MYHAIVRRNVEKLFEALGRGDIDYVVAGMASRFEHIFPGDHTLGGVRHTRPGIRAWFERLFRVLPCLSFKIKHIAVSGWPWATTVVVEWRDFATLAGGTRLCERWRPRHPDPLGQGGRPARLSRHPDHGGRNAHHGRGGRR